MNRRGTLLASGLAASLSLSPALAWSAGDTTATAPSSNPYLASGVRLYEALEFTAALENLKKAEKYSSGPAEDVLIHTYEGIIQANLNTPNDAEPDFRIALSLDPHAQLPRNSSPKIRAVWEQIRREMVAKPDLPTAPPAPPPPPVVATAPVSTPDLAPTVASTPSNFAPAGGLGTHLVPVIATAGGGVLLAGIGIALGLVAQSTGKQANSDGYQSDASNDLHNADQQQAVGDVLIGVGAAALVGAGVLYYMLNVAPSKSSSDATPAPSPSPTNSAS